MNRIIFIIPYMGNYPWYFPYFLHSCRYNPTVDFLIFTDNNDPYLEFLPNVQIIPCSIDRFKAEAAKVLGFDVAIGSGYKLCDLSSHSDGSDGGLYRDTSGWIHFLQQMLWILFYFSTKAIIFVRLFPYGKVFTVCYVQPDKRKPTAGLYRLHRLLYFTRAVQFPRPVSAITSGSGTESVAPSMQQPVIRQSESTNGRDRHDDSDLWLPVRLFLSRVETGSITEEIKMSIFHNSCLLPN